MSEMREITYRSGKGRRHDMSIETSNGIGVSSVRSDMSPRWGSRLFNAGRAINLSRLTALKP